MVLTHVLWGALLYKETSWLGAEKTLPVVVQGCYGTYAQSNEYD